MSLITKFLISQDLSTLIYEVHVTDGSVLEGNLILWNPDDPENIITIIPTLTTEISGILNLAENELSATTIIGNISEKSQTDVITVINMIDSTYQYEAMNEMIDILNDIFTNGNEFNSINKSNRDRLQILHTLLETIDLAISLNDILQANAMITHLKNVLAV